MNEESALVAACLEKPNDLTCRLVLADWLDEHAMTDQQKARSEWIRLACGKGPRKTERGKDKTLDDPNKQTLKHHAEDMIAAGQKILQDLGKRVKGTPQPK